MQYWKQAIAAVHQCVDQCQVATGASGEEYALIMLSAAADGAATKWKGSPAVADTLKPIKVHSWLTTLLRGLDDQAEAGDFRDMLAWADAYVLNFTHFITMDRKFAVDKPLRH